MANHDIPVPKWRIYSTCAYKVTLSDDETLFNP